MKFEKAEDTEYFLNRHVGIVDGREFEICIHPLLWGSFAIVGSFVGSRMYEFHWTAGDNRLAIYATQVILIKLIEKGLPLKDIPSRPETKPWMLDQNFVKKLDSLTGENIATLISKYC